MIDALKKLFAAEEWVPARRVLTRDADWWNAPREGCEMRFGFVEQKELSGKKLLIDGHQTYRFEGSASFISHRLSDLGQPCCSLIVASAGRNDVYLALSRKLAEREWLRLFSDEERERLPDLSSVPKLYVREHTPGIKDWVTMQYRLQLAGVRGEKTAADGTARAFRYTLFVSEEGDKALEIESYDDGGFDIHATLYRPVSDIVQLTERRAPPPRDVFKAPALTQSTAATTKSSVTRKPPKTPSVPVAAVEKHASKPSAAKQIVTKPAEKDASADVIDLRHAKLELVAVAPVPTPLMQAVPETEDPSLACNIRVAAKIIDEALRNDMQLSDVVRRVLGLPVAVDETVRFHLPLSTRDYHALAERYHLDPSEHEAIRSLIIEDLIDFTGERQKTLRSKVN